MAKSNSIRPSWANRTDTRSIKSLGGPFTVLSNSISSFAPTYINPKTRPLSSTHDTSTTINALTESDLGTSAEGDTATAVGRKRHRDGLAGSGMNKHKNEPRAKTNIDTAASSILSLFEDRSKRTVGIAIMDTSTRRVTLHEYEDLNSFLITLSCIKRYDPSKILFPKVHGEDNPLKKVLTQECLDEGLCVIEELPRKYFDDALGEEIYSASSAAFKGEISLRRCCLGALAALIRFSEYHYEVMIKKNGLSIHFNAIDNCMLLTRNAMDTLELFETRLSSSNMTLSSQFSVITSSGRRILSNAIRFPLVNRVEIEHRLDVVEFIRNQPKISSLLASYLLQLHDLETLVSRFVFRSQMRDEPYLRRGIKSIVQLYQRLKTLTEFSNALQQCVAIGIDDLDNDDQTDIASLHGGPSTKIGDRTRDERISNGRRCIIGILTNCLGDNTIDTLIKAFVESSICLDSIERPSGSNKKEMGKSEMEQLQLLSSLKPGVNSYLDAARARFIALYQDLLGYVDLLREQHPNIAIKSDYSEVRGYFLTCLAGDVNKLTHVDEFVWVQSRGRNATFSTFTLQSLNASLKDLKLEMLGIVHEELEELFKLTCRNSMALYQVNDAIGMLDFFLALARFAQLLPVATRPQFDDHLKLSGCYHPLYLHNDTEFKPLDIELSPFKEAMILTGPNGSGKSTVLRTLGIAQILSQIGSFVPASKAHVRIVDHLMSRLGGNVDAMHDNLSSFGSEMATAADILAIASHRSLILFDELGQATNPAEGSAITWSIMETLHRRRATIFLVTHFPELARLCSLYPRFRCARMKCKVTLAVDNNTEDDNISDHDVGSKSSEGLAVIPAFLIEGGQQTIGTSSYGINCAAYSGFPKSIIRRSFKLHKQLINETSKATKKYGRMERIVASETATMELGCQLQWMLSEQAEDGNGAKWKALMDLKKTT